jgi:hypothetical protein
VRWALYTNTVPGQGTKFHDGAAVDALRDLLLKVWNVYSFFVTYANIDKWDPAGAAPPLEDRPDMDRWILAELDSTVRAVRDNMDGFRSHMATRRITDFNEALSNWYVRRSRDRFWASGDTRRQARRIRDPLRGARGLREAFGAVYAVFERRPSTRTSSARWTPRPRSPCTWRTTRYPWTPSGLRTQLRASTSKTPCGKW